MTEESRKRDEEGGDGATLEGRLRRLEEIVGQLESDEVELERALALFEEGVAMVREAEALLSRTELRVEELLAGGRKIPLEEGGEEEPGG